MNILFIGGGNMAAAIIGGLTAGGWPAGSITAVDVLAEARTSLERRFGIRTAADAASAANAECIVLAVKPQQMREVAKAIAPVIGNPLVVSIAAGIRCTDLARWLGPRARIVRAMPNTPALVAAGISGLYAMPAVTADQRKAADRILAAVGADIELARTADLLLRILDHLLPLRDPADGARHGEQHGEHVRGNAHRLAYFADGSQRLRVFPIVELHRHGIIPSRCDP